MQQDHGPDRQDGEAEPHYVGHRQRLRQRFAQFGAEAMPDYELLELVLFRAVPRRDVKPMAKALIRRFGSFAEVVMAPVELITEVPEVTPNIAGELKLMGAVAQRIARGEVMKRPLLSSWSAVLDYIRTAMAFAEKEQFRILFLDKRNVLIADELQQTGTVDHTPVYPREVARRALDLSATAVLLVHNHPSGDPTPSQADIAMTREIVNVLKPLGVIVHDHVIIGRDGHASMKGLRLI